MKRHFTFLTACTLAALAWSPITAHAQSSSGFANGDRAVITVDNLAGVVHQRAKVENGDTDSVTNIGTLATFGPIGSLSALGAPPLTRIGFHYFVDPAVSLGSGFFYNDTESLGTTIVLAPRIGFAFQAGTSTAFWLRAGMTWSRWKIEVLAERTVTNVMPAVDALFVISPVDHFSFTVGGTAEVGVYGKTKTLVPGLGIVPSSESEQDIKCSQFGLVFGALASF